MSNKQDTLKMQTCVLRVNIHCHCDGCKKKIRKLLQKIDGVYSTQVNAEQGRVTVTGNVDPAKLIKTLEKSGKHAELWGPQKAGNYNYSNLLGNFKNIQVDVGKGGEAGKDKSQKSSGKGQLKHQHLQFKGPGNKLDQKNAKFNSQEDDFDGNDGEFDGDFDDNDVFEDDYEDDDKELGGHRGPNMPTKMMAVKGNSEQQMPHGPFGMMNGPGFSDKKGGVRGGNAKKGGSGAIEIPVLMKGKGGNNDGKKGKSGQGKEGTDGKNGPGKGVKDKKEDGKDKSCSKSSGGGLLGFLKRSKSGQEIVSFEYDSNHDDDMLGGGGMNNGKGAKKGGGKGQGIHEINKKKPEFNEFNGHTGPRNKGQMDQMGKMGPTGPVGLMGNYSQMGDMPGLQGHQVQPGMAGGYYKGMGPPNPYSQQQQQQQQYMAMLMNQQRQNGNDMYQPMMYARPYPALNYMPPPMPPPPVADPLTQIFSDENTESCSVM